ncbi:MAG: helix-turn-helix domain-containing protein [Patescibacteria group bacterium]|nr:helix-turn-helix domain-containing protein [Patescibacteria group bacterium]
MFTSGKKKAAYAQALGLTENELSFYLTLVKLGASPIQRVTKELGIFRSSGYVLAEALVRKGLVSQQRKKRGQVLVPEPPKALRRLLEKRETELAKTKEDIIADLPKLTTLFGRSQADPIIKVYEGVEGLKIVHDDILETGETMYCYPRLDTAVQVLPVEFQMDFIQKRVERGIKAVGITLQTPVSKLIVEKSKAVGNSAGVGPKALREMRVLPDHLQEAISGEKIIYGNKVAYLTYDRKIMAVVIEHPEIVAVERKHFDILWRVSLPWII